MCSSDLNFFVFDSFNLMSEGAQLELVPDRLRGDVARFDISTRDGKLIVGKDKRINARHIRDIEAAGLKHVSVPDDYLIGRTLANAAVDAETGEIVARANDEITEELLKKLRTAGVKEFRTLYTNDLDQGPYISQIGRAHV